MDSAVLLWRMQYRPRELTWSDVDPARHDFAAQGVAAVVLEAIDSASHGVADRNACFHVIHHALVTHYGDWISGWCWARDEGWVGGGPVSAWCCPSHSVTTREETAERAQRAVLEWRDWLVELSRLFAAVAKTDPKGSQASENQAAVLCLIDAVVERTGAGDAWYAHCAQVLGWYFQTRGVAPQRAESLIEEAIGGRFESWCAPTADARQSVAQELAERMSRKGSP